MEKLNLLQKLNEFRKKVGVVKKDGINPHFKNKYATIESVLDTIDSALDATKLGFYQAVQDDYLETIIFDTENTSDTISSKIKLLLPANDMQKLGSAITYARRYALVSIFGLEQEDDDGNGTIDIHTKITTATTTPVNPTYPKKKASFEKLTAGDSCPDCSEAVSLFKYTSKQDGSEKIYWKCKSCGLAGFEVKPKEVRVDSSEIPF